MRGALFLVGYDDPRVLHALPLRHFTFAVHAGAHQFRELHVCGLFLFQGFVFPSVGCPSHRACRQGFVSSCCPPGGWPWCGQHRRRGDRPPCVCRSAGSCVHRGCGPVRSCAVAWVVDFWLVCQQARLCGSSMVTPILQQIGFLIGCGGAVQSAIPHPSRLCVQYGSRCQLWPIAWDRGSSCTFPRWRVGLFPRKRKAPRCTQAGAGPLNAFAIGAWHF